MVYRRPMRREVDVEDDYPVVYESGSSGPASIFMIFLVILALGWLITKTESGSRSVGANIESAPVTAPVYTQPTPPPPIVVTPVVAPVVSYETAPIPEVVGRTTIRSNDVNLRTGPGFEYEPSFLLARNVRVAILNQSHTGIDGESWVKVGIETPQGPVRGWVNRRYIY